MQDTPESPNEFSALDHDENIRQLISERHAASRIARKHSRICWALTNVVVALYVAMYFEPSLWKLFCAVWIPVFVYSSHEVDVRWNAIVLHWDVNLARSDRSSERKDKEAAEREHQTP